MDQVIPDERASRDFRVKFPDDVMQENLAGQLWFGAEVSFVLIQKELYKIKNKFLSKSVKLSAFKSLNLQL